MRKALQWLLSPIRVTWFQPFYEKLYLFAIYAMNYGGGSFTEDSGERYVIQYVANKLSSQHGPILIFDVGANIGSYTHLVMETMAKRAIIHCFEPSRATFQQLTANITASNVYKHNLGLSAEAGQLALYTDAELSGMTSVYKRNLEHINVPFDQQEIASFSTIDEFCAAHDIEGIDLLKIDVEGHELSVLKGAKAMLSKQKIRFIQFEFGGTNIDSRTFFRDFWLLLQADYILYRIVGNGLRRIDNYSELLELFVTVNYFAERK